MPLYAFERTNCKGIILENPCVAAYTIRMVTTDEAADRLGVSRRRVLVLIHEGRIKAKQFGRTWVVDEKSLASVKPLKRGPKPKRK